MAKPSPPLLPGPHSTTARPGASARSGHSARIAPTTPAPASRSRTASVARSAGLPFTSRACLQAASRRLSKGETLSWKAVLFTVFRQRERQMGWMAFVVLFIFWVWVYQVRILIALLMGLSASSNLERFLTTLGTIASISPLMGLFGMLVSVLLQVVVIGINIPLLLLIAPLVGWALYVLQRRYRAV